MTHGRFVAEWLIVHNDGEWTRNNNNNHNNRFIILRLRIKWATCAIRASISKILRWRTKRECAIVFRQGHRCQQEKGSEDEDEYDMSLAPSIDAQGSASNSIMVSLNIDACDKEDDHDDVIIPLPPPVIAQSEPICYSLYNVHCEYAMYELPLQSHFNSTAFILAETHDVVIAKDKSHKEYNSLVVKTLIATIAIIVFLLWFLTWFIGLVFDTSHVCILSILIWVCNAKVTSSSFTQYIK